MKSKSVALLEGNKVIAKFRSIGDAARITEGDPSHIAKVLRGERQTANGAKWKEVKRFTTNAFSKGQRGLKQVDATDLNETVALYPNAKVAAEVTKIKDTKIADCLIGKAKKVKGYTFLAA